MANRDWYLAEVIPHLGLPKQPLDERGHKYGRRGEQPYLLAYMRKQLGGRTYYVIVEDDVNHLAFWLFPQFFPEPTSSKLLYQVVDEQGDSPYGMAFAYKNGVAASFVDSPVRRRRSTAGSLRVTEPDRCLPTPSCGTSTPSTRC